MRKDRFIGGIRRPKESVDWNGTRRRKFDWKIEAEDAKNQALELAATARKPHLRGRRSDRNRDAP